MVMVLLMVPPHDFILERSSLFVPDALDAAPVIGVPDVFRESKKVVKI